MDLKSWCRLVCICLLGFILSACFSPSDDGDNDDVITETDTATETDVGSGTDTGTDTAPEADLDTDNDGIADNDESDINDADNDGVVDRADPANNDPCVPSNTVGACDEDNDGIADGLESDVDDADNDGIVDRVDPANNDPCVPSNIVGACDEDNDGIADGLESDVDDADNDGIVDRVDAANDDPCLPIALNPACVQNGNVLLNGDFEEELNPFNHWWSYEEEGLADVTLAVGEFTPLSGDISAHIYVDQSSALADYHIQFAQNYEAESNYEYRLSFKIKSTHDLAFRVGAQLNQPPWGETIRANYFITAGETLNVEQVIAIEGSDVERKLVFNLGFAVEGSEIWIDDVVLQKYDVTSSSVTDLSQVENRIWDISYENAYGLQESYYGFNELGQEFVVRYIPENTCYSIYTTGKGLQYTENNRYELYDTRGTRIPSQYNVWDGRMYYYSSDQHTVDTIYVEATKTLNEFKSSECDYNLFSDDFESGDLSGWYRLSFDYAELEFSLDTNSEISGTNSMRIDVIEPGHLFWSAQIGKLVETKANHVYTLSYKIKANAHVRTEFYLRQNAHPDQNAYIKNIYLEPSEIIEISQDLAFEDSDKLRVFSFALGNGMSEPGTSYWIDDVNITEKEVSPVSVESVSVIDDVYSRDKSLDWILVGNGTGFMQSYRYDSDALGSGHGCYWTDIYSETWSHLGSNRFDITTDYGYEVLNVEVSESDDYLLLQRDVTGFMDTGIYSKLPISASDVLNNRCDSDGDDILDVYESDVDDADNDGTPDLGDPMNEDPCIPDLHAAACDLTPIN